MVHLPSFSIVRLVHVEGGPAKRIPVMQGWAIKKDARRALMTLSRAYPQRTLILEDE